MDWNDDGKKDILTGENSGNIRIYLNTGTDEAPAFSGYTMLQVGGTTFDAGSYSWIHVPDWNNDGLLDVLCGESEGRIYLMINEGTPGAPLFNSKPFLLNGASILDVGSRSSPTITDWNGDGKKDLLSGNSSGNILLFENKGTNEAPVFNGYTQLQAGGALLDVGYDAHPDVADWNNDGVMDILTGEFYGSVLYFEAVGPLSASETSISATEGGRIMLDLNAGAANAGRNYLILGTVSGTDPGIPLPGGQAVLPVNWDTFTNIGLALLNTSSFHKFMGALDGAGTAQAKYDPGPIPGGAGQTIHFAYALNQPFDYASNAVMIEILP